LSIPEREHQT